MKINNVNPTISVIIPLYNSSDYIKKCIESVINQTYLNIEIIIVDDFSQDDSILKIKTLKDCRIKIISHKTNKGTAAARNTGIKAARGEFVIFLDSDDYVDSDLVIKCIQEQQKNNVDCVVYNRLKVNDLGNSIEPYVSEWDDKFYGNKIENKCINNDETETLIGWDVVPTNKFISLKYLKQNKIYFLEEHRYFEDHYFCAKLYLSKVRFSYIDEKLYYYRKRSSIINKSITQLNSLDVIIYKSRVFRDVCFLIESVDNKYKNIFYHAYFKSYKRAIAPMINSKKYQKEAYKNLQRAFQGIKELEIVKNMQNISDLDLALLIDHYDYEEYLNKFGNIFGYSLSDIKDTIPKIFHNRLKGWIKPELLHSKKKIYDFRLVFSGVLFLTLCIYRLKFFRYRNFLLKLRDFHLIYYLGEVNYLCKSKNFKKLIRIFDYVIEGEKSGKKINDKFNAAKYLKQNPDLAYMNMGLYSHFLFFAGTQQRNVKGMR